MKNKSIGLLDFSERVERKRTKGLKVKEYSRLDTHRFLNPSYGIEEYPLLFHIKETFRVDRVYDKANSSKIIGENKVIVERHINSYLFKEGEDLLPFTSSYENLEKGISNITQLLHRTELVPLDKPERTKINRNDEFSEPGYLERLTDNDGNRDHPATVIYDYELGIDRLVEFGYTEDDYVYLPQWFIHYNLIRAPISIFNRYIDKTEFDSLPLDHPIRALVIKWIRELKNLWHSTSDPQLLAH